MRRTGGVVVGGGRMLLGRFTGNKQHSETFEECRLCHATSTTPPCCLESHNEWQSAATDRRGSEDWPPTLSLNFGFYKLPSVICRERSHQAKGQNRTTKATGKGANKCTGASDWFLGACNHGVRHRLLPAPACSPDPRSGAATITLD